MVVESNIAFWNVENLFDQENDPNRPPELQATLAGELEGWTAAIRDQKIENLASIIIQMFNGQGPDLLGVCEVENEAIVQRLANQINIPGRNYGIVAHNSPDARGIDVSFIFDQNTLQASEPSHQVVIKRPSSARSSPTWACPAAPRPKPQPASTPFSRPLNHTIPGVPTQLTGPLRPAHGLSRSQTIPNGP